MKPLRNFLLAVTLLVGVMIGVVAAGSLERFLEPIVSYLSHEHQQPKPTKPSLVPVDFDPFADQDPCETNSPHQLCI
jgi:hypothetical protein